MMAGERRGLHAYAFLQAIFAQVRAPRPRRDGDVNLRAFGRHAHFFRAIKCQRTQVATFQFVDAHHFAMRFHDFGFAVGHRHLVNFGGIKQPVGVLLQPENGRAEIGRRVGLVGADAFENGQAIVQRMCQHMGGGIAPGDELAVVPNEAITVGHRHFFLRNF